MELKLTINDSKTGKSYNKAYSGDFFLHKKIRDRVDGSKFGFDGYEFVITGGSDRSGFPMRPDISGIGRKRPLTVTGVGVKKKERGMKQRKTIKGNIIDETIAQINLKIEKFGKENIEKILGIEKEAPAKEEKKESDGSEEKPKEGKQEGASS